MIAGLDSEIPPTPADVQLAVAGGVGKWSGYLATRNHVGLGRPWTQAEFEVARQCGTKPIAFCSGWDDPVACKALAAAWDVLLCLDIENGIRGYGGWTQPWLDVSGAGAYGNFPVLALVKAPFYVGAAYVGHDPKSSWPPSQPRPLEPCGWQWEGSHPEFGDTVDRQWLDDWFGPPPAPVPVPTPQPQHEEDAMRSFVIEAKDATPDQPFTIASPISIAGRDTNWNATARTFTQIQMYAWAPDGTSLGNKGYEIWPNKPNEKGPVPASGTASELGATGPCTLGLVISGPVDPSDPQQIVTGGPVVLVLHDETT